MAKGTSPIVRAFALAHRTLYRLTGGRLGGTLRGVTVILLTTTGRRSGREYTTPLSAMEEGDTFVVVGSNGGSDDDPNWLRNLRATPRAAIEVRGRKLAVTAEVVDERTREALWPLLVALDRTWARYARKTERVSPVVRLRPAG